MREVLSEYLDKFGLGTLFAANVLGAGSIYILSQTGASTGFGLLWVLPLAFALDMLMHDMSGRMAADNRPLMEYIRDLIGNRPAQIYAVTQALVMQLWAVANYAVAGALLAHFIGFSVTIGILISAGLGIGLVSYGKYKTIEGVISAMMFTVFAGYTLFAIGLAPSVSKIASGLIPTFTHSPALIIGILGTTVYYPNFFIHSSMKPTKEWESLKKYRLDNGAGILISVIVSAAILTVGAMVLPSGELGLLDPALPMIQYFGNWAYQGFLAVIMFAAFTSATGTLFGSGFAVPQAFGKETEFGNENFTKTVVGLIGLSGVLSVLALTYTEMTPVRMAIVMPSVNGLIYLPLTISFMLKATWGDLGRKQRVLSVLATLILFAGSILTAQSLYNMVMGWI